MTIHKQRPFSCEGWIRNGTAVHSCGRAPTRRIVTEQSVLQDTGEYKRETFVDFLCAACAERRREHFATTSVTILDDAPIDERTLATISA